MPNVIDLYAGAGGLSLGAARAGFTVTAAVELEPHAIETHSKNFPNTIHIRKDIMELTGSSLLEIVKIKDKKPDGIIGGPPCQGFSSIGQGNVDDSRNCLFIKFFELVEDIQPSFFLAENVPGIMNPKYDEIRAKAFQHVSQYSMFPIKVAANEYGAPTTRTRIFFIGFLPGKVKPITKEDIEQKKVFPDAMTTVRQAFEGLPEKEQVNGETGFGILESSYFDTNHQHSQTKFFYEHTVSRRPPLVGDPDYIKGFMERHEVNGFLPTVHTDKVAQRYANLAYGQKDEISKSTRLNPDGFCPTLRAGTGPEKGSYQAVRPIHYKEARVIMPREAARLQGFPDWFCLPDTIWHSFRQIGNSVSPIVAEQVLNVIFQKLTK